MKVLLVGEYNPYGGDPRMALYPAPGGSSGQRLAAILGYARADYLRTFDRVNLLDRSHWSVPEARRAVATLTHRYRVLHGARVAAAHGVPFVPFARCSALWPSDPGRGAWLMLPHPSGRSRLWNAGASNAALLVRALVEEAAHA